jgi:predicted transcriptional regulator
MQVILSLENRINERNMNNNEIKNHLIFFKQNVVNLRDQDLCTKIDRHFDRTLFIQNIDFLERNSLIVENDNRDSIYSITEKGEEFLKQVIEDDKYIAEKERIEFENSKINLELSQKMLKEFPKTKWFARIGLFIAIVLALKELYILLKPKL